MSTFGYSATPALKIVSRLLMVFGAVFASATAAADTGTDRVFWQHQFVAAGPEAEGFITSIIPLQGGGFLLALRFGGSGRQPSYRALEPAKSGSDSSAFVDAVAVLRNGTVAIAGRSLRHDGTPQRTYVDGVAWLMLVTSPSG